MSADDPERGIRSPVSGHPVKREDAVTVIIGAQ